MAAKEIGVRIGKVVGWTGATLYKGAEMAVAATGELGEGFSEGVVVAWENRCEAMDRNLALAQAKAEARRAELLRLRAEAKAQAEAEVEVATTTTRRKATA